MRNVEGRVIHIYACVRNASSGINSIETCRSSSTRSSLCFIPAAEEMRTSETNCREKTLVLVGKTRNGKSATGNSIIGRDVFDSVFSLAGVTSSCQLETTKLDDGQIINVIDTPGFLDTSVKPHDIAKEIARCITLAKDGIHSLILVLSISNRFAEDEVSVFNGLHQIFGPKISDYMIVVFCHGDVVPESQCLDDVLSRNCPELLQRTLEMCGNRRVLFDNKTKDEAKISRQREELVSLVNDVVDNNGGMPYTDDLFDALKISDIQRFERLILMVESRLRESIKRIEKQVEEERAARQEAEAKAQAAEASSKEEIRKLAAFLETARLEAEARERAAIQEERAARREAEAKAQAAEESSKEEILQLAALLETARLEADKKSKEERDKLSAILEKTRSEADAEIKHLKWEIDESRKLLKWEADAEIKHLKWVIDNSSKLNINV